jgi:hypothetical protein
MSACTFELRCDFVAAKQRLEECALSGDYKGTVLYDKFEATEMDGPSCLIMLFHQYEYRISYKLQADAVVGLFERRSGPPVLHVMSYEGKGITKKWFDFCDYMSSAFRDVILSSNN